MLSYLTRLGIRKDLSHSSSKTIEFILKKSEEYKTLPFDEYLKKYFKEFDAYDNEIWSKIISKLVQPAYDESRCHEMVYVYGYLDKKHHDFISQYEVYSKLKNDDRLTDDIRQFIGFLAGADEGAFFKQYNLTIEQWFNMKNWHNPNIQYEDGKTLNEILSYPFGMNYFKILLTQMPFWNR